MSSNATNSRDRLTREACVCALSAIHTRPAHLYTHITIMVDHVSCCVPARAVVSQFFVTEAENENVIRANSAIMKCKIPSFVSEFVYVDQWVADDGTIYTAGEDYGRRSPCDLSFLYEPTPAATDFRFSPSLQFQTFISLFPSNERIPMERKGSRDTRTSFRGQLIAPKPFSRLSPLVSVFGALSQRRRAFQWSTSSTRRGSPTSSSYAATREH